MNNDMPVRQAALGSTQTEKRSDVNMDGFITVCRVLKVHHKYNTADVIAVRGMNAIIDNADNEGRFSARICVNNAKYDEENKKAWGEIQPISEGELVLVGFIDGYSQQPVIIGSLHRMDNPMNILTSFYPIESSNKREHNQYIKVFPRQDYIRVDGMGNIEFVNHQKSFIKIDTDGISDERYGTDFHNLYLKDKITGETISYNEKDIDKPVDYIFVQRSSYDDNDTTWTKFYLQKTGKFRLTRDNHDNTLLFVEINPEGNFRIKRQLDNYSHDSGINNSSFEMKSNGEVNINRTNGDGISNITVSDSGEIKAERLNGINNSKITISPDGAVNVNKTNENGVSYIQLTFDGTITLSSQGTSKSEITVSPDGVITLSSDKININAPFGIGVNSDEDLNITSNKNINISAKENINIMSGADTNISSENTNITANTHILIDAPLVDINPERE